MYVCVYEYVEVVSPPLTPSGVSHRLSLSSSDTPDASNGSHHNLIRQLKNELIKVVCM